MYQVKSQLKKLYSLRFFPLLIKNFFLLTECKYNIINLCYKNFETGLP